MSEQEPSKQDPYSRIKRIHLPSGRFIEVLRFYDHEEDPDQGLHICRECDSKLVQPVAWSENEDDQEHSWNLTLHCPNCLHTEEGVYTQAQVDALEEVLDEGLDDMLTDLRLMTRVNMAEEIGRFTFALANDFILPEDF